MGRPWSEGKRSRRGRCATAIGLAVFATWPSVPARATDTPPPSSSSEEWSPPIADPTEDAWLELTTGEWLKGEIKLIDDETVYFDSAQFGELQIDWDDVRALRMPSPHTFRFTGRRVVTGVGEMRGDVIRVRIDGEVRQYKRKDFVSMVRGTGREIDFWNLNLSVGLSGQAGNTDQISFNTTVDVRRETALTRVTIDYTGNVATQASLVSANNHRVDVVFDVYLTSRLYIVIPSLDVFQDEFQNIDLRLTPSAGLGYDLIDTRRLQWRVTAAMGFQETRYISVATGSDRDGDAAVQLNSALEVDLPNRFDWTTTYQPQIVVTDLGKSSQNLSSTLSFDFWGPLDFDTTFQWDWTARPVPDAQGVVPESSDFRVVVSLALDL